VSTPKSRAAQRAHSTERILGAAQAEFAERGLSGATIRAIARRAGVDPSLVIQRYGSKEKLFAEAVLPAVEHDGGDAERHLADVLDARTRGLPAATEALLRSAPTSPEAADVMRDYLIGRVERLRDARRRTVAPEARSTDAGSDPEDELRAALIVSSILGVTMARHIFELDILERLDRPMIDRVVAPWLAGLWDAAPSAVPTGTTGTTGSAQPQPPIPDAEEHDHDTSDDRRPRQRRDQHDAAQRADDL